MTEPVAHTPLHHALLHIEAAVAKTVVRVSESIGERAAPPAGVSRQNLLNLQLDLQRKLTTFNGQIQHALRDALDTALTPRVDTSRAAVTTTHWEMLSLVDDTEVDAKVRTERLSEDIGYGCEWELRELDGFVAALLQQQPGDRPVNPLRPDAIGKALLDAVESIGIEPGLRNVLARDIAQALAPVMRTCYALINNEFREQGIQPISLAVRSPASGSGSGRASGWTGSTVQGERGGAGDGLAASGARTSSWRSSAQSAWSPSVNDSRPSSDLSSRTGAAASSAAPVTGARLSDQQMLEMLRRLSVGGSSNVSASPGGGFGPSGMSGWQGGEPDASRQVGAAAHGADGGGSPVSGMMAVNLIRQHRDELVRASSGALDHMVIDVVSAMFDHLLSDTKVPPQLARQIARLQMPVLRAALKDSSFFSSRRHPVRRFVNRIASLAAAYDDLDDGPGREFLERVRALVQDIVEGDFDQMELYESKLHAIELLITEQSRRDVGPHAAAAVLLDGKETELRIQQRFMRELKGQLQPLELPAYLLEFLSQVWSQVQVHAAGPGGSPELLQRMRTAARELVMSVQPKGDPQLRKEFLLKLPQLMKDLNEGLALIRWPDVAKSEFFGKLLPAHANSLKAVPLTDFAQRQLKFKLDQVEKVAIPTERDIAPSTPAVLPPPEQHAAPLQFSHEEAVRIGLVEESAVDWNSPVDIELDVDAGDPTASASAPTDLDIGLQIEPRQADNAPPTHGPQLIHNLHTGVAYRMHVEGVWKRVRLSWVSPGRAFFVFTHGKSHLQTISMTSRMLMRMCESERFRTFEPAELIERATARARKQLTQLNAAAKQTAMSR